MADNAGRKGVLAQISNPLVFFGLALLIIEGIIGAVTGFSKMTGDQQFYCIIIMAVLFFIVVVIVAFITIKWPSHLYEQIAEQVKTTKQIKEFLESTAFKDIVEEIVDARIRKSRS